MTKKDKTLKKWEHATSETWKTVEAALKRSGFVQCGDSNGTHYSFVHPVLALLVKKDPRALLIAPYGPDGRIEIIRHGKIVYGYVLQRILDALAIIEKHYRLEESGEAEEE